MSTWNILRWGAIVVAGPAALYGMHRLALWLEDQGYIYYLRKKPGGSAASCFVALQRNIEPQAQYVQQVREEAHFDMGESAGSDPGSESSRGDS